jgi:hypothetical protein
MPDAMIRTALLAVVFLLNVFDAAASSGADDELTAAQQRHIAKVKHRTAERVADSIRRLTGPLADASTIQSDLQEAVFFDQRETRDELSIQARVFQGHIIRLALVTKLSLPCGSDSWLQVFTFRDGRWSEALRWQSPAYQSISAAFDSFQYELSSVDAEGHWFVATAHLAPWCSSTWSTIFYNALLPRQTSIQPRELFKGSDPIWWGGSEIDELSIDGQNVHLRFEGNSVDGDRFTRVVLRNFKISGNSAKRVAPIAETSRDFLEEWIASPWRTVADWSNAQELQNLRRVRESIELTRRYGYQEFGPTMGCAGVNVSEIEVMLHGPAEKSVYFSIRNDGGYMLKKASTHHDDSCSSGIGAP